MLHNQIGTQAELLSMETSIGFGTFMKVAVVIIIYVQKKVPVGMSPLYQTLIGGTKDPAVDVMKLNATQVGLKITTVKL